MKMYLPTLLVLMCTTLALGQRPFFAGPRPIGYPEVTTEALGDRFGEVDGTTQRLPIEANGDRDLVDRLSKLPIDKQPFWLINWQALEAHRQNPQTYPQKPNPFVDPIQSNGGSNSGSFNSGNTNFNPGNVNFNLGNANPNLGNANPNLANVIPNLGNANPNLGNVNPNFGNANPNLGNVNPSLGNANPNLGNGSPNRGNVNSNSGSVASDISGFLSANRFGVEEHPNNQDPIENAFTNYNSGTGSSNSSENTDKKKSPTKVDKNQYNYRPYT